MGVADDDAALAAELTARTAAEATMAAALVELERHPGHTTLAAGTCTGRTAQRWAAASVALAALWADFATYRDVVDAAAQRPAQRRRLLREAVIEVGRTSVPLARRGLTGAVESVETITLDALATRMDAAFRAVSEVVTGCDGVQRAVFSALVPLAARAQDALATARELDPRSADLDLGPLTAAVTAALADVERTSTTDPLALADRPVAAVLAPLATALDALTAHTAHLDAVRTGWADGLARLDAALTAADQLHDEAASTAAHARELIADTDPAPIKNHMRELRARRAALDAPRAAPPPRRTGLSSVPSRRTGLSSVAGAALAPAAVPAAGWAVLGAALTGLLADVDAVTAALRAVVDDAAGLLERRSELRGRYAALQAKAARRGRAERSAVLAADARVRDLLWTRPCDLRAATVALVDYQRLVAEEVAEEVAEGAAPCAAS